MSRRHAADPHRGVRPADAREALALELLGGLWRRYRARVPYVRVYERLVARAGASFVNDHVAFRTFASQAPCAGIHSVSRVFEALGYAAQGCYSFPEKRLSAVHLRHPSPGFPKVFVSELRTWELSSQAQDAVAACLATHRPPLSDECLAGLRWPERFSAAGRRRVLAQALGWFCRLPWDPPAKERVEQLDRESQYAAWTLLHGYDVNHFTASVDSHGPGPLRDIERTVAALRRAGVPMKARIEGARGSRLRQSSTEASPGRALARAGSRLVRIPWTYAYFELAERGYVRDPATGRRARFEGFLDGQAANLFEMTRRKG